MSIYLIDNPPRIRQFRSPRRERPSGVVIVHTAETFPDETGPDTGAENVARFIRDRTNYGSYHDLADSDSIIQLVRYSDEAFHDGTGSNRHSYGVSAATQAAKWNTVSGQWRDATVRNMAIATARYATWLKQRRGVIIPPQRISRSESEDRKPGFISHAERDPARRTDPGKTFPWAFYLDTYDGIMNRVEDTVSADDVLRALEIVSKREGETGRNLNQVLRENLIAPGISWAISSAVSGDTTTGRNLRDNLRALLTAGINAKLDVIVKAVSNIQGVDAAVLAAEINRIDAETLAEAVVTEQAERLQD